MWMCRPSTQQHTQIHDATADSGINDQLIKMHSTHSWIKCVLSSSISYFVVCCFDNAQVSNLVLTITA